MCIVLWSDAGHKDIHSLCSPLNLQLPAYFSCYALSLVERTITFVNSIKTLIWLYILYLDALNTLSWWAVSLRIGAFFVIRFKFCIVGQLLYKFTAHMAKHADFHNFMRKQTTAKYNYNYYYCFRHVVDSICSFTEMCVYLILYSLLFKLYRIDLLFYIILNIYYTCVWDHTGFCCCCLFVVVFFKSHRKCRCFREDESIKGVVKINAIIIIITSTTQ